MRIAFDLNPIVVHRFSGFYAYGAGLLKGIETLQARPEFLLFHSRRFHSQAELIKRQLGNWAELKATSVKMRWLEDFWRYSGVPKLEFFTGDFDIFHSTHHLMPPTKDKPKLLTVYDLRRYKLQGLYKASKLDLFELAVKRADHFIAISQAAKDDLCEIFGIPRQKVDVVYLAANTETQPVQEQQKKQLKEKLEEQLSVKLGDYLVVFSSPDERKNIIRIINAFMSVQDKLPSNYKLVVVGNLPKNEEAVDALRYVEASDRIVLTGPVDDISNLFRCAEGLVFASLYEGFGIPIVEAFGCAVPVITSNCSSMPEVAADAALYVEPYDIDSIGQAMIKICQDGELRTRLVSAGLERGKQFNWQRTAKETVEVYRKLL